MTPPFKGLALIPFAIAFGLRLPSLFVDYYNIDELTNTLFAHFLLDGDLGLNDFLANTHIFTHYLYTAILGLFGRYNLMAIHLFHALWVGMTAIALYLAGLELNGSKRGGLSAGILYALFSVTFMSKDFHAALSESFSLLPASLAALFFLKGIRRSFFRDFFWCGFFIGLSALFKSPAGIMMVAVLLALPLAVRKAYPFMIICMAGLMAALAIPFLFALAHDGTLNNALSNLFNTKIRYIEAYENLPFLYWFSKFLLRTLLIIMASFPLWYFAFLSLKKNSFTPPLFFLFVWLLSDWFVVAIGKRVFYHYYIFLIPSLCLLASCWLPEWLEKNRGRLLKKVFVVLTVILVSGFTADGIFQWSLRQSRFERLTEHIRGQTKNTDTIYVWGLSPQIYFYSQRKPASTMIWADLLAGFSPGSPAMEYMRATGKNLNLPESILRDLRPSEIRQMSASTVFDNPLSRVNDRELLSVREILDRIDVPAWKKLFVDFFKTPPVLFVDTSPAGYRGFGNYPLEKYDLLKKFVETNYVYEITLDGVVVYRLRT